MILLRKLLLAAVLAVGYENVSAVSPAQLSETAGRIAGLCLQLIGAAGELVQRHTGWTPRRPGLADIGIRLCNWEVDQLPVRNGEGVQVGQEVLFGVQISSPVGNRLAWILRNIGEAFNEPGLARELYGYVSQRRYDEDWAAVREDMSGLTRAWAGERVKIFAVRWLTLMTIVFIAKVIANDGKTMARVYDKKNPKNHRARHLLKLADAYLKMLGRTALSLDVNPVVRLAALGLTVA